MNEIDNLFRDLNSINDSQRFNAFKKLQSITENKVSWIYDKWDELVVKLASENSYQRSIGLILLANLAKSDDENRFALILDTYLNFFEDEKFITSRQCILHAWKIALVHSSNQTKIISRLERAYVENRHLNSHANLIKQDIISSLFEIYRNTRNEEIMIKITALMENESDEKVLKSLKKMLKL